MLVPEPAATVRVGGDHGRTTNRRQETGNRQLATGK
jgi:hypothetical protein